MHGFINSPALAKLVALQMVDEQLETSRRARPRKSRGAALRRVQLAMLKDPQRRHPFYWAAFIQAGDWTPLSAR